MIERGEITAALSFVAILGFFLFLASVLGGCGVAKAQNCTTICDEYGVCRTWCDDGTNCTRICDEYGVCRTWCD